MAKRSTAKRQRLKTPTSTQYAKRTRTGHFKEMDDVRRSQAADRRKKAKGTTKAGYGDQGDQKRRAE